MENIFLFLEETSKRQSKSLKKLLKERANFFWKVILVIFFNEFSFFAGTVKINYYTILNNPFELGLPLQRLYFLIFFRFLNNF